MPFVTPEEIVNKAENAYPRFLAAWIRGETADFFPLRLRVNLGRDKVNPAITISANEALLKKSKPNRSWGYTVHREQIASRDFGSNLFPKSITIDSLDDLLRLANQSAEFDATREFVSKVRAELPNLEDWLVRSVKTLHKHKDSPDGLIAIAKFFINNPWPNCYARQIPVPVDTKFVMRNRSILRQWFDILLPPTAIDVNEKTLARRFGLRDGEPHRGIRLLDPRLSSISGLPFGELSLPLRSIAELQMKDVAVFIVENDLNLLTMPLFENGIGIRGEGNAVNRLERVKWLHHNRVFYWGDIDVDGFVILSRVRNLFPHVESILMDMATLNAHKEWIVEGNGTAPSPPTNLTEAEFTAFVHCLRSNQRLEQEKILQPFGETKFASLKKAKL